jgi:hypothetical protein
MQAIASGNGGRKSDSREVSTSRILRCPSDGASIAHNRERSVWRAHSGISERSSAARSQISRPEHPKHFSDSQVVAPYSEISTTWSAAATPPSIIIGLPDAVLG